MVSIDPNNRKLQAPVATTALDPKRKSQLGQSSRLWQAMAQFPRAFQALEASHVFEGKFAAQQVHDDFIVSAIVKDGWFRASVQQF